MESLKINRIFLLISLIFTIPVSANSQSIHSNWKEALTNQLQLHGHRNWVLVTDAAYPYQSNPAIKTIVTGAKHVDVVKEVLSKIKTAPHVFPEIYLDKELDFVPDKEAPGIENYRQQLQSLLAGEKVSKVLHEEMISRIDEAAETFHILVLKTNFTLPYTSVFINLNCVYWHTEQENKLRKLMPDK